MKIEDKDIATVEALHDLLLDKHGYELSFITLKRARELTKKMYAIIDMDSSSDIISENAVNDVCDKCKSGLINYPDLGRRTCRCGAMGYNVTDGR